MSAEPITFEDFEAIKEFALDLGSALAADLMPAVDELRAERDRARDLACALEARLALIAELLAPFEPLRMVGTPIRKALNLARGGEPE